MEKPFQQVSIGAYDEYDIHICESHHSLFASHS